MIDVEAIARPGCGWASILLGGAAVAILGPIAARLGLAARSVNETVDPTSVHDRRKDGRIRMDCSSPFAMAGLIGLKDRFDLAFGNDTDCDRHGS